MNPPKRLPSLEEFLNLARQGILDTGFVGKTWDEIMAEVDDAEDALYEESPVLPAPRQEQTPRA